MFDQHRSKLYQVIGTDIAFLIGGVDRCRYDSDTDVKFRQESNFYYITGCDEPDCCCLLDGKSQEFHLFVPRLGPEHELWMGRVNNPELQQKLYKPTKLHYSDTLQDFLKAYTDRTCHVILDIPTIPNTQLPCKNQTNDLQAIIAELRLSKDAEEVKEMEQTCVINSKAFNYVMSHLKPGMKEYEAVAMHAYVYLKNGSPSNSFNCIAACDKGASVLHYMDGDKTITENSTFLLDAGCEVRQSCSDHTRTFPTSLKFTPKQEQLYNIVLKCNKTGIAAMKPGVKWEDVHFASLRVLLEGLREVGIINPKEDIEVQHKLGIASIFQPHGLGHMLGLNTHDVGGYNKDIVKSTTDHRIKYLRTRRTLAEGMILTVEPGLYFVDGFLNEAKNDPEKAKHINFNLVEEFRKECGGYRIEDDVLVTKDGHYIFPGPVKELSEIYALRSVAFAE